MPYGSPHDEGYQPAEDTFFLDDHIKDERGMAALDIGCGSGYLTRRLEEAFELVVGTDISHTILRNRTYAAENVLCCNGADALICQFDLVVCNMPYLDTDNVLDATTDGGPGGLKIPMRIIYSAVPRIRPGGRFLFITSSLADFEGLITYARTLGLDVRIAARKRLFFEELILVEARKTLPA